MAVSGMKRLDVITMSGGGDGLIRSLQRLKCVELTKCSSDDGYANTSFSEDLNGGASGDDMNSISEKISAAAAAEEFLAGFYMGKRGLFSSPPEEDSLAFEKHRESSAVQTTKSACKLRGKLLSLKGEIEREREKLEVLEMWSEYDFPIPVYETKNTVSIAGTFPSGIKEEKILERLEDLPAALSIINISKSGTAAVLSCTKEGMDEAVKAIKSFGFTQASIAADENDGYARGALKFIREKIKRLEAMQDKLLKSAKELSEKLPEIETYYDVLTTRQAAFEAKGMMEQSRLTERLSGWVPEKKVLDVTRLLEKRGDAYSFRDPAEGEDVPVLLDNSVWSSSFEPVISLYSLPAYGSFDPSSLMSIFYVIIFGLMFADVGYGLLFTGLCFAALKMMNPTGSFRKFLRMFAACGISCAVMGVLFGGYFGDLPQQVMKQFMGVENPESPALWFDMVANPMLFLVVSVAVGAVHLFAGLCAKFYVLFRKKSIWDAVFDAGSWILLFIGAGISLLWMNVGIWIVVAALAMLVLTQGRHEKNIIMKAVKGIGSLYDIVGYVSDLLSYSRILSLGLASAVIASVFNILGTMAGPGIGSVIGLILVFAIGHPLNMAINMLGAFVHTSRLQYIEFFGKFYEDGGRPFEPLSPRSKYVIFR